MEPLQGQGPKPFAGWCPGCPLLLLRTWELGGEVQKESAGLDTHLLLEPDLNPPWHSVIWVFQLPWWGCLSWLMD